MLALRNELLLSVLNTSSASERVDVVFDIYKQPSIKDAERSRRSFTEGVRFSNIIPGHQIKQWKRLLSCGPSKMKLIAFIADQWKTQPYRERLGDKTMYVTSGENCTMITWESTEVVGDLQSTQEEADNRLLLHCKHASSEFPSVIIAAEDTYVFILCLAFQNVIGCKMFIRCGSSSRLRLIDVKKLASALGVDVCKALIGFHAFTGCDTVSAFSGRGKGDCT